MKLSITNSGESFTITGQTIDKLVRAGNGDAALLYLYTLRTHGHSTDKQIGQALGKTKGEIATATALLSKMGLIEAVNEPAGMQDTGGLQNAAGSGPAIEPAAQPREFTQEPAAQPREFTQDEVIEQISSGSDFSVVVDETTRRLGKPLSPDEMMRLYGIYENLRLPPEVISLLITHCISICRTTGDGRPPSVRYIEKAAYTWEREGIFTLEKAEEYLKAFEARKSFTGQIKQILQIRDREFSETERRYAEGWVNAGFAIDVIALAYDKTIIKTGGLNFPYMDAILKKWDEKNAHTLEEVHSKDERMAGSSAGGGTGGGRAAGTGSKSTAQYGGRISRRQAIDGHGKPNREQIERMNRLLEKIEDEDA